MKLKTAPPTISKTKTAMNLLDDRLTALRSRRRRVTWLLTGIMVVAYFGFILALGNFKHIFQSRLFDLPIGIPWGIGLILLACGLTGIYVYWANKFYDPMAEQIKREMTE